MFVVPPAKFWLCKRSLRTFYSPGPASLRAGPLPSSWATLSQSRTGDLRLLKRYFIVGFFTHMDFWTSLLVCSVSGLQLPLRLFWTKFLALTFGCDAVLTFLMIIANTSALRPNCPIAQVLIAALHLWINGVEVLHSRSTYSPHRDYPLVV